MPVELEVIAGFINRANCVEDVFGDLGISRKDKEKALHSGFRKLTKTLHPDLFDGDAKARVLAETTFKKLEEIRHEAAEAIKADQYGKRNRFSWKIPVVIKGKYVVESPLCAGHIADLHLATLESSKKNTQFILKTARLPQDNDLLSVEKQVLDKLLSKMKAHGSMDWPETIPKITETFLLDCGGVKRRVNVMERFEGFYNGVQIRAALPSGVDGRTLVWMWKRLLVLMEWVNKTGFIHGAILPPHVMFYPDNDGHTTKDKRKHAVRLVDWCYAVPFKERTRLSAWVKEYESFYAPEVLEKKPLGPWTDLYMGAWTILYLAGVDIDKAMASKKGFWINDTEKPIADMLVKCIAPKAEKRPQSIGKYFEEFNSVARKVYGVPKYHDFNLPVDR